MKAATAGGNASKTRPRTVTTVGVKLSIRSAASVEEVPDATHVPHLSRSRRWTGTSLKQLHSQLGSRAALAMHSRRL